MKRSIVYLEAALLSLASAWAAAGCLATAFSLPVTQHTYIGLAWLAGCLISLTFFSFRRGGRWLLALCAAGLWLLWRQTNAAEQIFGTLGIAARLYDSAYGWGIPELLQDMTSQVDLPLALLGMAQIISICRTVCRRKGNWLSVALMILPLAACLVVTDTVPDSGFLFVLLLCLILLLLTDSVRPEGGNQGSRLTVGAVIPLALALGLLFYKYPQESYVNNIQDTRDFLLEYAQQIPEKISAGTANLPSFVRPRDQVNLSSLSGQLQLGLPVAEVAAQTDGTLYLRMQDYDTYTGTAWVSSPGRQESISGSGENRGTVTIRELRSSGGTLLPAFPNGQTILTEGKAGTMPDTVYQLDRMTAALGSYPGDGWMALPEYTGQWAGELIRQIPGDMTTTDNAAQSIAQYVRNSAEYSLRPGTMSSDFEDFAQWFLTSADKGYCVHFATSAAVLLRAAGIPARYVTGYKVDALAGETVRVTSNEAHAWVEYYNFASWTWKILEATPGDAGVELAPETEEQTTQVTEPPQTQTRPAAASPETTQPAATVPDAPEQEPEKKSAVGVLLTAVLMATAAGAAELQRRLRIALRRRRYSRGSGKQRVLARWREARRLSRLLGSQPPEELEHLAEKAMFSQHPPTKEEIARFSSYTQHCRRELRTRSRIKQLIYRYWYAVY